MIPSGIARLCDAAWRRLSVDLFNEFAIQDTSLGDENLLSLARYSRQHGGRALQCSALHHVLHSAQTTQFLSTACATRAAVFEKRKR